jgi:hypothetical protein
MDRSFFIVTIATTTIGSDTDYCNTVRSATIDHLCGIYRVRGSGGSGRTRQQTMALATVDTDLCRAIHLVRRVALRTLVSHGFGRSLLCYIVLV